jgi:hypothetical protein
VNKFAVKKIHLQTSLKSDDLSPNLQFSDEFLDNLANILHKFPTVSLPYSIYKLLEVNQNDNSAEYPEIKDELWPLVSQESQKKNLAMISNYENLALETENDVIIDFSDEIFLSNDSNISLDEYIMSIPPTPTRDFKKVSKNLNRIVFKSINLEPSETEDTLLHQIFEEQKLETPSEVKKPEIQRKSSRVRLNSSLKRHFDDTITTENDIKSGNINFIHERKLKDGI